LYKYGFVLAGQLGIDGDGGIAAGAVARHAGRQATGGVTVGEQAGALGRIDFRSGGSRGRNGQQGNEQGFYNR